MNGNRAGLPCEVACVWARRVAPADCPAAIRWFLLELSADTSESFIP